jgi:hypothetical protein
MPVKLPTWYVPNVHVQLIPLFALIAREDTKICKTLAVYLIIRRNSTLLCETRGIKFLGWQVNFNLWVLTDNSISIEEICGTVPTKSYNVICLLLEKSLFQVIFIDSLYMNSSIQYLHYRKLFLSHTIWNSNVRFNFLW